MSEGAVRSQLVRWNFRVMARFHLYPESTRGPGFGNGLARLIATLSVDV